MLREDPRVLRVRLDGPPADRVRLAMQLDPGVEKEAAERARARFDRTHEAYTRQFYGIQIRDPSLYHLMIESTSIELEACVEIIARAAHALLGGTSEPYGSSRSA